VTDARMRSQRPSTYQFITESVDFRSVEEPPPQIFLTLDTALQHEEKIKAPVLMYLYGRVMPRYGSRGNPRKDG
jgi:hypothetical protein